jgi:tetratricopeptide (TPR) repeat protein
MTIDERRRQKRRAKKAAERKAKQAERKSASIGVSFKLAARFPTGDCLVPADLFDEGIGTVVMTRLLPHGQVAVASFLVDVFCLGVKDVLYRVVSPAEYGHYREQIETQTPLEAVHPSCLRKLVEGAVRYAQDLGFSPHADYARAAQLFGDIDAAACPIRYTYGKDGQPFYISGPYDSAARSRKIIDTLARRLGPTGFHYIAQTTGPQLAAGLPMGGQDLELTGYEITDEPLGDTALARLPDSVKDEVERIYHLLRSDPKQAVSLSLPLIEQRPEVPQLYNYLLSAYQMLHDEANAQRVLDEMLERFPDYLFGRIAHARSCLKRGELDKVSEIFEGKFDLKLLYPNRERFHTSEVLNFGYVMVRYFHARGDQEIAENYYDLLQKIDPDHEVTKSAKRLLRPSPIAAWLRKLVQKS